MVIYSATQFLQVSVQFIREPVVIFRHPNNLQHEKENKNKLVICDGNFMCSNLPKLIWATKWAETEIVDRSIENNTMYQEVTE
jgi:hypothetical protein